MMRKSVVNSVGRLTLSVEKSKINSLCSMNIVKGTKFYVSVSFGREHVKDESVDGGVDNMKLSVRI
jgi:hypothetical protein